LLEGLKDKTPLVRRKKSFLKFPKMMVNFFGLAGFGGFSGECLKVVNDFNVLTPETT